MNRWHQRRSHTLRSVGRSTLVNSTAKHLNVEEVSADKAYSNKANLTVVENKGAKPYIDFRKNTRPTGKVDIWHRMFHYYQMNQGEFYDHYHKRSNVESLA